jgi:hypothetical protein
VRFVVLAISVLHTAGCLAGRLSCRQVAVAGSGVRLACVFFFVGGEYVMADVTGSLLYDWMKLSFEFVRLVILVARHCHMLLCHCCLSFCFCPGVCCNRLLSHPCVVG